MEQLEEEEKHGSCKYYDRLIAIGGRPSAPINPDPDPCPSWKTGINKQYHALDYLLNESGRAYRELQQWKDFRSHRQMSRRSLEDFNKYKERIRRFEQEKGIEWTVQLQLELEQQTKLNEWREYYIYEYRKRDRLQVRYERAQLEMKEAQEKLKVAALNGSKISDTILKARSEESLRYDKKMEEAREELRSAQKRLKEMEASESHGAIESARSGLEEAQKRLEVAKSDEMEQLVNEWKRKGMENGVEHAIRGLSGASLDLEALDSRLKWIAGEFPKIAVEIQRSRQDQDKGLTRLSNEVASENRQHPRKSARHRGNFAPFQPALGPFSARVSKVTQRKGDAPNRGQNATLQRMLQSEKHADGDQQQSISKRAAVPLPSDSGPVHSRHPLSSRPLRRSVRIRERTEKLRALASDPKVESHPVHKLAKPTSRHITFPAGHCGKPQGVSKTKSRRATVKRNHG